MAEKALHTLLYLSILLTGCTPSPQGLAEVASEATSIELSEVTSVSSAELLENMKNVNLEDIKEPSLVSSITPSDPEDLEETLVEFISKSASEEHLEELEPSPKGSNTDMMPPQSVELLEVASTEVPVPLMTEEILLGPGADAPILRSADISSALLPMEHRAAAQVILPDVFSIPRSVSGRLSIDLFLSLFFVFLNDDWEKHTGKATLLAPANLPHTEAAKWLSAEESLTEELLMAHIILGEPIRPELLTEPQTRTTQSGSDVVFQLDSDGNMLVNGVRVLSMDISGHILIIALEDYLFKEEIRQELMNSGDGEDESEFTTNVATHTVSTEHPQEFEQQAELLEPTPRVNNKNCSKVRNEFGGGLSIFKSIVVCSQTVAENSSGDTEGREVRVDDTLMELDRPERSGVIDEIATLLQFFRGGPTVDNFLTYAREQRLSDQLDPDTFYTVLAPTDEAFREWYPIDWGFSPFDVDTFVNTTLLNHIIPANLNLFTAQDGANVTTLAGNNIQLSIYPESSLLNGVPTLGEMDLISGKVIFLEKVLFVNSSIVKQLNKKYRYLESGPLVTYPWFRSQFLSHAFRILEGKPEYSQMTGYMNETSSLGQYAPAYYDSDRSKGYTLFVPSNAAFSSILTGIPPKMDPLEQNESFRLEMLLGHLVAGRHFAVGLVNNVHLTTLSEKMLTVHTNHSGTWLHDGHRFSKLIDNEIYVYNLGTIIPIDSVLFVDSRLVKKATGESTVYSANSSTVYSANPSTVYSANSTSLEDTDTVMDMDKMEAKDDSITFTLEKLKELSSQSESTEIAQLDSAIQFQDEIMNQDGLSEQSIRSDQNLPFLSELFEFAEKSEGRAGWGSRSTHSKPSALNFSPDVSPSKRKFRVVYINNRRLEIPII